MELKRVVVTGLGAVTPLGNTVEETWNNLVAGKSGAAPIKSFDTTLFKTKFACEVKDLDVNTYLDRKEARKMDRYTQLALIAAKQAVADSAMDLEKEDKNRIGVVFGVGIGGIKTFEDEVKYYGVHEADGPKFNPFFIPKMIADIAAGQISIMYGFHGPNYITASACASSSNALADAFNLIRLGKANIILGGGAEAAICATGVGGFNAMHALSTRNDEPEKASRPFSASRDGFIMAEGAGCLVLEELEQLKRKISSKIAIVWAEKAAEQSLDGDAVANRIRAIIEGLDLPDFKLPEGDLPQELRGSGSVEDEQGDNVMAICRAHISKLANTLSSKLTDEISRYASAISKADLAKELLSRYHTQLDNLIKDIQNKEQSIAMYESVKKELESVA